MFPGFGSWLGSWRGSDLILDHGSGLTISCYMGPLSSMVLLTLEQKGCCQWHIIHVISQSLIFWINHMLWHRVWLPMLMHMHFFLCSHVQIQGLVSYVQPQWLLSYFITQGLLSYVLTHGLSSYVLTYGIIVLCSNTGIIAVGFNTRTFFLCFNIGIIVIWYITWTNVLCFKTGTPITWVI